MHVNTNSYTLKLLPLFLLFPCVAIAAPAISQARIDKTVTPAIVTIEGSGFGTKDQPSPVLWDFGNDVRENGIAFPETLLPSTGSEVPIKLGAGNSIWAAGVTTYYSSVTRSAATARSYHSKGNGWIGWPYAFGGLSTKPSKKAYISWRIKTEGPITEYVAIGIDEDTTKILESISSGKFEKKTALLQLSNGKEYSIESISLNHEKKSVTINKKSLPLSFDSYKNSKLLSQDKSIALSLKPEILYGRTIGAKYLRSYESGYAGARTILTTNRFFAAQYDIYGKEVDRAFEKPDGSDSGYGIPDISKINKWSLIEVYLDFSKTEGEGFVSFDSRSKKWFHGLDLSTKPANHGPTISNIGFEAAGGSSDIDASVHFGEIYFDKSPQRVIISTSKKLENISDNIEYLFPKHWSEDSISAELRLGSLSPSAPIYIYVYDESNNANTVGHCLMNCSNVIPAKSSAPSLEIQ